MKKTKVLSLILILMLIASSGLSSMAALAAAPMKIRVVIDGFGNANTCHDSQDFMTAKDPVKLSADISIDNGMLVLNGSITGEGVSIPLNERYDIVNGDDGKTVFCVSQNTGLHNDGSSAARTLLLSFTSADRANRAFTKQRLGRIMTFYYTAGGNSIYAFEGNIKANSTLDSQTKHGKNKRSKIAAKSVDSDLNEPDMYKFWYKSFVQPTDEVSDLEELSESDEPAIVSKESEIDEEFIDDGDYDPDATGAVPKGTRTWIRSHTRQYKLFTGHYVKERISLAMYTNFSDSMPTPDSGDRVQEAQFYIKKKWTESNNALYVSNTAPVIVKNVSVEVTVNGNDRIESILWSGRAQDPTLSVGISASARIGLSVWKAVSVGLGVSASYTNETVSFNTSKILASGGTSTKLPVYYSMPYPGYLSTPGSGTHRYDFTFKARERQASSTSRTFKVYFNYSLYGKDIWGLYNRFYNTGNVYELHSIK